MKSFTKSVAYSIVILTLASVLCLKAEDVSDPIPWFATHYGHKDDDKIIFIRVDLDHDGHLDYLVAYESDIDRKVDDCAWTVFLARNGHYIVAGEKLGPKVRHPGIMDFGMDHYFIGFIPELKKYGVLTAVISKAGESQLIAYILEGDIFEEVDVGEQKDENELPSVKARFLKEPDRNKGKPPVEKVEIPK